MIDLDGAHIQVIHEPVKSNKDLPHAARLAYKFSIAVPTGKKSILQGGSFKELRFGCETPEERQEWISCLQIVQQCEGKFNARKSLLYAEKERKIAILQRDVRGSVVE